MAGMLHYDRPPGVASYGALGHVLRPLPIYFLPQAVNCLRFCFWRNTFLLVYEISPGTSERICAKFDQKVYLVSRSDEFEGQGQRSRSPRTKDGIFGHFGGLRAVYVW